MTTARPARFRDFCEKAERLGFAYEGQLGSGHLRFRNADLDITYTTSQTPSDWRAERNAIAAMERLAGRKLERPKAARYRHRRVTQLDTHRSAREELDSRAVNHLLSEADSLVAELTSLVKAPPSRDIAEKARTVIARYNEVRDIAETTYRRIIPPITGAI